MTSTRTTVNEIISLMISIGLNERDARVYSILLSKGEKQAKEIAKLTSIPQPHIYSILKTLYTKEIIEILPEKTKKYRAIDLEMAIDRLISEKENELVTLKNKSHEIAQRIEIRGEEIHIGKLEAVIGEKNIEKKILEMIQSVKREILVITSASLIINYMDYKPLWKDFKSRRITARILTYFEAEKIGKISQLIEAGVEVKFLEHENVSRGLIVDDEALIEVGFERLDKQWDVRIRTDYSEIVKASRQRFEKYWENALSLEDVIKKN